MEKHNEEEFRLPKFLRLLELYIFNLGLVIHYNDISKNRKSIEIRVRELDLYKLSQRIPSPWELDYHSINIRLHNDGRSILIRFDIIRSVDPISIGDSWIQEEMDKIAASLGSSPESHGLRHDEAAALV